jgi:Xaa-Pro aminopeptidase
MKAKPYLQKRILKLQSYLKENKLDAFFVTNPIHLFYLTNYQNEDGFILITQNKAYFMIDARSYDEALTSIKVLEVKLINKDKGLKHYIENLEIRTLGYEANHMTVARLDLFEKSFKNVKLEKTINVLENFRIIKDEYEILQIKKACSVSKEVFEIIEKDITRFKTELDIAEFFLSEVKSRGASSISFPTIVANGEGSSVPHYSTANKSIDVSKLTLIDFGCVYNGYCSDCTRILLPVEKSIELMEAYNHVKYAKNMAIEMIKPGVNASFLDKAVRDYLSDKNLNKYFTHSLGHGVGIEVHDGLVISSQYDFELKENMIITIEPGLYFKNEFGIRLEDTVRVNRDGSEILT